MHPFGGTVVCPRCSKAVYAAEQIMGPGRKLYHKPCLTCTTCGKRLDSYNLVEHDQEPYCKNCHVKNFGTRDLRLANLPNRDQVFLSPPTSPTRAATFSRATSPPARSNFDAPPLPARHNITGTASTQPPILKATRTLSPVRGTFSTPEEDEADESPATGTASSATHVGRVGGLPRTVPLSPTKGRPTGHGTSPADTPPPAARSARLLPTGTGTGTRYGAALGGAAPLTPMATGRQWGGGTPSCPKCGQVVYHAEQVKAVGKTYHKGCLRCTECNTSLDSTRLTERDGHPFCHRCYGKLYGPQGSGYALLGKAGG